MRWLGPMLHMLYPPKHDPTARELAAILDRREVASAHISETRVRLERMAADRGSALDDVAGDRP